MVKALVFLEGKVCHPGQHPPPAVHRGHQLVGAARGHAEGKLPAVHLDISFCTEMSSLYRL